MNFSKGSKIAGVLAIAFVLVAGAVGLAQDGRGFGGGRGKREGHRAGFGRMFSSLNLTEAQKAQIQQIAERNRQATATLREQLRTKRDGAADLTTGTFDEQAFRAAAQARANARVELEVAHARMFSEMYAVLTPEQKAQLEAQRNERKQRREQFRQHRNSKPGAAAPGAE
jgi:Spy/CpxP family protein refolding chaperone